MRKSKVFLSIGCLMVLIAVIFIVLSLNHPEMSFPWANGITYIFYMIYLMAVIAMFVLWLKMKNRS